MCWAGAAALPPLASVAYFMTVTARATWFDPPRGLVAALMPEALLFTTLALTAVAPLAGVRVASRLRGSRRGAGAIGAALGTAWPLVVAAALVACSSAGLVLALAVWGGDGALSSAAAPVLQTHGTLFVAGLTLALFGAVCGAGFEDVLDAAAVSTATVVCATAGVLVAGSAVSEAPRALVEWALTASPLVAVASVARYDLTRSDTLYQISPLAHLQVDLPAWPAVLGAYLTAAALCFVLLTWLYGLRRTAGHMDPHSERTFA